MHPEDKIASRIEPLTNLRQPNREPLNIKASAVCMNRIDFLMKDVIVSSQTSLETLLCHTIYWESEELVNFVYEMIYRDQFLQ
uniref:DDHD domain-containing protein n=1 Tax=Acrobeloides nanus TaxID=290746 RepID=A0A914C6F5_9BILA